MAGSSIRNKSAAGLLFFFLVYAMSPIYAAIAAGASDGLNSCHPSYGEVQVGILWVNVLLVAMDDDAQSSDPAAGTTLQASPEDDIVLIRKKRARSPEGYSVRPLQQTAVSVAVTRHAELPRLASYQVPRDVIHRHSQDYSSLSTGLSPPPFVS